MHPNWMAFGAVIVLITGVAALSEAEPLPVLFMPHQYVNDIAWLDIKPSFSWAKNLSTATDFWRRGRGIPSSIPQHLVRSMFLIDTALLWRLGQGDPKAQAMPSLSLYPLYREPSGADGRSMHHTDWFHFVLSKAFAEENIDADEVAVHFHDVKAWAPPIPDFESHPQQSKLYGDWHLAEMMEPGGKQIQATGKMFYSDRFMAVATLVNSHVLTMYSGVWEMRGNLNSSTVVLHYARAGRTSPLAARMNPRALEEGGVYHYQLWWVALSENGMEMTHFVSQSKEHEKGSIRWLKVQANKSSHGHMHDEL